MVSGFSGSAMAFATVGATSSSQRVADQHGADELLALGSTTSFCRPPCLFEEGVHAGARSGRVASPMEPTSRRAADLVPFGAAKAASSVFEDAPASDARHLVARCATRSDTRPFE